MKKNIYKSTITVMLCLLFFMQKDILADNPSQFPPCTSSGTSESHPYGNLGVVIHDTTVRQDPQCFYSYDASSNCVSGSICNLPLIPIGDPQCNDRHGCTTSLDCPNKFTSTNDQSDTAWTFKAADIADKWPTALNPPITAVIWDPLVQAEKSTVVMWYDTPVQNNEQMPTIQLAYDTKSTQQITILDNTTDNIGHCDHRCRTVNCP